MPIRKAAVIAGAALFVLLGACSQNRSGDDWEYRKDPMDNSGRVLRPAPDR